MSYLIYILAPIVVFLVLAVSVTLRAADSPKSGVPAQPEKAPAAQTPLPPARDIATFSKTKLRQMLAKIESSRTPKIKNVSAMCYAPPPMPNRAEYICPICNQKTLYVFSTNDSRSSNACWHIAYDLTTARRLIGEIQKYAPAVRLRENNFCDNCYPNHGTPNLGVIIRYDDGTEIATDNISTEDLQILLGFFSGALIYNAGGPDTKPLQKDMPRLKQLLGEPANPPPTSSKKK